MVTDRDAVGSEISNLLDDELGHGALIGLPIEVGASSNGQEGDVGAKSLVDPPANTPHFRSPGSNLTRW